MLGRNDLLLGFPEISSALGLPMYGRNLLPPFATRHRTPGANDESHDLAGLPTQGHPDPAFAAFFEDK